MKIIEKKSKYIAGGFGPDVAIAEIAFDDGTYTYGEWSQEMDDYIYATSEESIYDLAGEIQKAEDAGDDCAVGEIAAHRTELIESGASCDIPSAIEVQLLLNDIIRIQR